MNKMNLNYEPDDPNEICEFPRCRNCFNDDTERCSDCVLNIYNPKTVFRSISYMSPYEILINNELKEEDIELVSDQFIKDFLQSAIKEIVEIKRMIDCNMNLIDEVKGEENNVK